jgi:hypothetical protein
VQRDQTADACVGEPQAGSVRSERNTLGTSMSTPTTTAKRHQTSGSAGSEMSLPKMAVNPQSSTQKWICSVALVAGFIVMPGYCRWRRLRLQRPGARERTRPVDAAARRSLE